MPAPLNFRRTLALAAFFLSLGGNAYSGVALDGTLGTSGTLIGPNYDITSDLGRLHGSNLFHSFSTFDIGTGETATFSGPATVSNIISRVTGGNASSIDGLIRSDIANANLYLINPNGIMFGQNASLDITGSFYATTADHLRLGSTGRFDALDPATSVFTSDPPAAFGFLSGNPGAAITAWNSALAVQPGQSINLIAGAISLFGDGTSSTLSAPGGSINLIAGGTGDVTIVPEGLTNALSTRGDISIRGDWTGDSPQLDVSNSTGTGGRVYISGGRFLLDNASVYSISTGDQQSGNIVIESSDATLTTGYLFTSTATGGDAGNIAITSSGPVEIAEGSYIGSATFGDGNAGSIRIDAAAVHIGGISTILSNSASEDDPIASGRAGDITIQATGEVLIDGFGWVQSEAFDTGDAGNITIRADHFAILGNGYVSSYTNYTADAGNILIDADTVDIGEQGYINSSALDDVWFLGVSGNAGDITILARERATISGSAYLQSETEGSGHAGTISIRSGAFSLLDSAIVSTSTDNTGGAGNILVTVTGLTHIDEGQITSGTSGTGSGGSIVVNSGALAITNGGSLSAASRGAGSGPAGSINITVADTLSMANGTIETSTEDADGGDIRITIGELLWLRDSSVSTSVQGGTGDGGNITLLGGAIALDDAGIKANAYGGNGGNIYISADPLIVDQNSRISASSQLGVQGTIGITAPLVDVGGSLADLPEGMLDNNLAPRNCSAVGNDTSSFVVRQISSSTRRNNDGLSF